MQKKLYTITIFILTISISLYSIGWCLHDDETAKKGGAWRSDGVEVGPYKSRSNEEIEKSLDKSFQKSPIVIPPLEEGDAQSDVPGSDKSDNQEQKATDLDRKGEYKK